MMNMTTKIAGGAIATAVALTLGVSGAHAAAHEAKPMMSEHKNFTSALAARYASMAAEEKLELDAKDEAHFANKAAQASQGLVVMPDAPDSRPIESADHRAYAGSAYQRLATALNGDAPVKHPLVLADAQTNYDCFLQEAEEGYQLLHIQRCHVGFENAMATINRPAPKPATQVSPPKPEVKAEAKAIENIKFTIYFGFDSAELTEEAQPVLQQAVAEFRRRADARIDVAGHADRAGSVEYNRALSKRRADAVRDALAASGVTAGRIDEAALGELVTDVETPDGVREPLNRRVEIVVSSQ